MPDNFTNSVEGAAAYERMYGDIGYVDNDTDEHVHEWGPMEFSRFGGEPHRKCQVAFCNFISIDFEDDEDTDAVSETDT